MNYSNSLLYDDGRDWWGTLQLLKGGPFFYALGSKCANIQQKISSDTSYGMSKNFTTPILLHKLLRHSTVRVRGDFFCWTKIQYSPPQRSLWMPPNVICSYYDKVETIWIWCVSEKRAHFNFTTCALLLGFGLRVVFGDLKPFFFVLSTHKNGPNSLNLWFCKYLVFFWHTDLGLFKVQSVKSIHKYFRFFGKEVANIAILEQVPVSNERHGNF